MGKATFSFKDYEGETSKVQLAGLDMTAGNFAAEAAKITALLAAIQGLTMGQIQNIQVAAYDTKYAPATPASKQAQREQKWVVQYYDDTTFDQYTVELPVADLSLLDGTAQDGTVDKTAQAWTDFVTAFEAYVQSPKGHGVVVTDAYHVGRSL